MLYMHNVLSTVNVVIIDDDDHTILEIDEDGNETVIGSV
jgi:hypothetical protein